MNNITWLSPEDPPDRFPPVDQALAEPAGLIAAGGDLSPARLVAAYERGIFPWFSSGQPVLWWSPDPREVLLPADFKVSRSLAKTLRNSGFELRFDHDFAAVIAACAGARSGETGTWITPEMQAAYIELHRRGIAHSVETWRAGALCGGLYGVQVGHVFCGESMFSRERDASKFALAGLVAAAVERGIAAIDCQLASRHLRSLGSRPMPRARFVELLRGRN